MASLVLVRSSSFWTQTGTIGIGFSKVVGTIKALTDGNGMGEVTLEPQQTGKLQTSRGR